MTEQSIAIFLKQLRKTSGLSANEVVSLLKNYDIEISSKTLYGYESGLSMLNADVFVALCRIYKCDNPMDIFGTPSIVSSEMELIEKYRSLDSYGQETVNYILDKETVRTTTIQEQANRISELESQPTAVIDFPVRSNQAARIAEYFRSASAGGGVFILGNEATSKIIVSEADWDDRIDYVISVSGHSMEPDYSDGDMVMVSQRLEMQHGDVGIFVINGKAYIKEYGEKELISRNPESDNIKISEYDNIVCMGKVIGKLKGQYEIIDD